MFAVSTLSRSGRGIALTAALAGLSVIGLAGPAGAADAKPAAKASCILKAGKPYLEGGKIKGNARANSCGGKWDHAVLILWAGNPTPSGVRWFSQDSNRSTKLDGFESTWMVSKRCSAPVMYRTQLLASKNGDYVKNSNSSSVSIGSC
ncbi:hypothetical protein ACFWJW_32185 [Streptomyces sp. NPDC127097]|uniref:hypothetical protein n=1 Tax=Streptomyces sp. NPDC127097 TaxID=3347136 RepID=UPI00365B9559